MKNGLYRVEFGTGTAMGFGVVIYREGQVRGGDAGFAYVGDVTQEGESLTGQLEVFQHTPGYPSVFGGLTKFTLDVQGNAFGDDKAGFHATTASAPGAPLKISMQLLRAD